VKKNIIIGKELSGSTQLLEGSDGLVPNSINPIPLARVMTNLDQNDAHRNIHSAMSGATTPSEGLTFKSLCE
jgi:hypothetical protein